MTNTILVVDNEAAVHDAISRHFQQPAFRVLTAMNGRDALDLMRRNEVHVVISDILMPVMSGTELLKIVRSEYPLVAVIMTTSYASQEDVMSCIRHGARACILKPWPDMAEMDECVARGIRAMEAWKHKIHELHDMRPTEEFIDESEHALGALDVFLLKVENDPSDLDAVNAVFRTIHSIKGNSASLGLLKTKQLTHDTETILDALRNRQFQQTGQVINTLFEVVDELKAIMVRLRAKQDEIGNSEHFKALMQKVGGIVGGITVHASGSASSPSVRAKGLSSIEHSGMDRMIRINEEALDGLSDQVDELLKLHSATIEKQCLTVLLQLQQGFKALRKVPIQTLLQKAPRMIRDVCAATGKKVAFAVTGGSISVSRSIVQSLDTVLLHVLRNAVDHGAEMPEERVKKGKKPECEIRIEAIQLPGEVALRISDDGRGIDFAALVNKAIMKGMLSAGDSITTEDAANLIFVPGLSASDKVTEVSGRGVGMDVVKEKVESIGGRIEISSRPDHGTQFLLILPNP